VRNHAAPDRLSTGLPLPQLDTGETIFSWCAAVHHLWGGTVSGDTSHALFGNGHAMRQHDIPRGLDMLTARCGGILGEPLQLLRLHSVAACYLPFLDAADQADLAAQIGGGSRLHWRRGLLSSSRSMPVEHPLRMCDRCCADDADRLGRPTWRVMHQLPGVWVCAIHGDPLWTVPGRQRRWVLPTDNLIRRTRIQNSDPLQATIAAEVSRTFATLESVNCDSLRAAALRRMRDIGVIHSLARARHDRITRWFCSTSMHEMCRNPLSGVSSLSGGEWICSQLWRAKRDHPARWILLWCALNWKSSAEATSALADAASSLHRREDGQLSMFSLEPGEVKAPDHVYAAFQYCESYAEVMRQLNVSRADVVRWLESDPGLRQTWRQGAYQERLRAVVRKLKDTFAASSALNIADVKQLLSDGANDIRWLAANEPRLHAEMIGALARRGASQKTLF